MASLLANGAILEAGVCCQQQSQIAINILHYLVSGAAGAPTDQMAVDWIDANIGSLYPIYQSTGSRYYGTFLKRVRPLPVTALVHAEAARAFGTVNSDPMPKQVSLVLTKLTNLAGRANRGRVYLPFWAESENDTGSLPTAAARADANTILTAMLLSPTITIGADSLTLTPVIYHRAPGTTTVISGGRVGILWATQRRRGDFGRTNVPPF